VPPLHRPKVQLGPAPTAGLAHALAKSWKHPRKPSPTQPISEMSKLRLSTIGTHPGPHRMGIPMWLLPCQSSSTRSDSHSMKPTRQQAPTRHRSAVRSTWTECSQPRHMASRLMTPRPMCLCKMRAKPDTRKQWLAGPWGKKPSEVEGGRSGLHWASSRDTPAH
jgi:hypothetical protein